MNGAMSSEEDLSQRLSVYLGARMPEETSFVVTDIKRFHGGASRETYRFTARSSRSGMPVKRNLILRRDPVGSLIDTERAVEFNAFCSFYGSSVPVPQPLFLEEDTAWLDRPFFIMEEVQGGTAASPFAAEPYGELSEQIGTQFWRHLGAIAATDVTQTPLGRLFGLQDPEDCWRRELSYWEGVINEDELGPQPIVRAAIRHLRRSPPPPPPRLCVVHGDYRTGNFLFAEDGQIKAVLDWEMAHIGDPHEDLAWALDPLWASDSLERPGGMIDRAQAIALWEAASGLTVNPVALRWWCVFAAVKGLAIWVSSAKEYAVGKNADPVLAFSGWYCTARHNRILLNALGH